MIKTVVNKFQIAMRQLCEFDRHLLYFDVAERSITHKLGVYLQPLFPEWDVDCEYNRNGHNQKTVSLPVRYDETLKKQTSTYPDIIIHRRGVNTHNLLIIEAKKLGRAQCAYDFDQQKVEAYACDLNYQIGIAIKIPTGRYRRRPFECSLYYRRTWSDLHI